jgi:cysteine desulfurase
MDNHSTTRVDPRVLEAMLPYFAELFGNAASVTHAYGAEAGQAVEAARAQIAELLGADPKTIVLTSGATEANNLAIKGLLWASKPGSHLIVNAAEHKAVLDPAITLERQGYAVTVLPVDKYGRVNPEQVAEAIRPNTALVSVMFANNEVGTINPVEDIGRICRERGVCFHTDATQALGKIPISLRDLPADLVSVSAHKMYGPKGIGAIYLRRASPRIKLCPLLDGGGHERHLRSGTLPVPLIVGFGAACALCKDLMKEESRHIGQMRDCLWSALRNRIDGIKLNGHPDARLPGNANITFPGVNSEALMLNLRDVVAVSSGSACTTADPEPSHVLTAMGVERRLIGSTIRFGLGRFNTQEEVDAVVDAFDSAVSHLRSMTP